MINTRFNRKIGDTLHDNILSEGKYNDAKNLPHLTDIAKAPFQRNPTLKEKADIFKIYKKQVPVIGGNGDPSVEMEDELSRPAALKRQMLGGSKSNVSFSKALKTVEGLEQAAKTNDGLNPPVKRVKKVIEGSIPLASKQLTSNKLKGGNAVMNEPGSLVKTVTKEIVKGDLPIPSAEPVKVKKGGAKGCGLLGGAKKAVPQPALSWNALLKKTCGEQKCNLQQAIKYIKDNNLYAKKAK